jgi:putative glutamine amidotransferase
MALFGKNKSDRSQIVIGITDCSRYDNYKKWIERDGDVRTIKLSYQENNLAHMDTCDGIILSGGQDVHPRFYNRKEYIEFCHEIDERRDDFEWRVLEEIEVKKLPMLGICRGMQMANVFHGGTLIPDLPAFGKFNHSKHADTDRYHNILVDPDSLLYKVAAGQTGRVNSAHHQSADHVGRGLVVNSFSPDGVPEGMERMQPVNKPYMMLVQWHPERMVDQKSPFTKRVRQHFVHAVKKQLAAK